jgi:glycosyltransferase involved in cell wall biosynthesis
LQTLFIALLDKSNPPDHSFVSGMLAGELANQNDVRVYLLVSKNNSNANNITFRYSRAICLPYLLKRKGIYRFINFFMAIKLLWPIIKKAKKRNKKVILFVRNDPILLLASSFLKMHASKLVFQSSFPHEKQAKKLKSIVATLIYKLCESSIDTLLSISPLGKERLKRLFPSVDNVSYIPLLADIVVDDTQINNHYKDKLNFIYVGSHNKSRELDEVLKGIVYAVKDLKVNSNFLFLGGNKKEIEILMLVNGVKNLVQEGVITFKSKVERAKIWDFIYKSDVGLSLIPPTSIYIEASPTKLAEYLSSGLAVIASRGISLQEQIIESSKAGILANFDSFSIGHAILEISADEKKLKSMRIKALSYSKISFSYSTYLESFKRNILGI